MDRASEPSDWRERLKEDFRRALVTFPPREREILMRRYALEGRALCPRGELCRRFGVDLNELTRLEWEFQRRVPFHTQPRTRLRDFLH